MKLIKYKIAQGISESGGLNLVEKTMTWSESGEELAKGEAYNGEYTIEDDGQPDPTETPSQLDIIEAQVAYTAMMTDTLLEV